MPTGKLEKLKRMKRTLESERHEAALLLNQMPTEMKASWTERVIDPLTTVIDNIDAILVGCKKLLRKQGFVKADQTFGGLL